MAMSTVVALGGVLGACGLSEDQADCAASAGDVEHRVSCVSVERTDDVRSDDELARPEPPAVSFAEADDVVVGTRIVVEDEDAQLVVLDGPANAFRETSTDGTYVAAVAGTYQVVPYVRMPCGGPPDETDARTITIVASESALDEERDGVGDAPSGLLNAGRLPSPTC